MNSPSNGFKKESHKEGTTSSSPVDRSGSSPKKGPITQAKKLAIIPELK